MNILVTGATGFIGRRFLEMAEFYAGEDDKLVLLSSKEIDGYTCILHENYTYDTSVFQKAGIDRIDKIIHIGHFMAQKYPDVLPAKGNLSGIKNTEYLIEHLPNLPEIFVYCSTMTVYGTNRREEIDEESSLQGDTPYAVSKIMTEMLLHEWARENHVRLHVLRLANIYGPREARSHLIPVWLNAVWRKEPIRLYANPDMYRNYVYIDDCCKALWAALNLREDVGIINVVHGKNDTMQEIARICKEISGNEYGIETDLTEIDKAKQCGLHFKNNDTCSRYLADLEYDMREGLKREFAYYERHKR